VGLAWLVIERGGGSARPVGGFVVFGLAVGALGMLGDLCESLIKREYDAKDSGTALGRMGGVLDLVDSLTLAAPGAWALWTFGCPG
jgi:phosphatidate cytidylyltransferase